MDIQFLQGIASIIGGLVFTFLISREESKPKNKRNKRYSKYGRPVLNQILKTKGINLSDEYIKQIHKTMLSIGKKRGVNEFHKNVTPKIEKILTKGLNDLESDSNDDDRTKLTKSIIRDYTNATYFKKLKSKNKSQRRMNTKRTNKSITKLPRKTQVLKSSIELPRKTKVSPKSSIELPRKTKVLPKSSTEYERITTKPFQLKPKSILKKPRFEPIAESPVNNKSKNVSRESISVHGGKKSIKKRSRRR